MKKNFKNNVLVLCAAFGMSACNVEKKNANQETQATDWKVSFEYEAPEQEGGTWKRIIKVDGLDNIDLPVDRQTDQNRTWVEIGFTDENGKIPEEDSTGTVRYRIGGEFLSEWVSEEKDLILTSLPAEENTITGQRCIVPVGHRLYTNGRDLTLNCKNLIVRGEIFSFPVSCTMRHHEHSQFYNRTGVSGGTLTANVRYLEVGGQININGQCAWHGGNGGELNIVYDTIRATPNSFQAEGGAFITLVNASFTVVPYRIGQRGNVTLKQRTSQ